MPEGPVLSRGFYRSLPELGFVRLKKEEARSYRDLSGEAFLTFERSGVRLAFSSNSVLYEDRGAVMVGMGESDESVLRALIVDPVFRGRGLATLAMCDLTAHADEFGVSLSLEVAPLEGSPVAHQQLSAFYARFGFAGQGRVLARAAGAESQIAKDRQRG